MSKRTSGAATTRSQRDRFLDEFGHTDEDHARHTLETELRRTIDWSSCGWWWCDKERAPAAPAVHPRWQNLLAALRALLSKGIEPNGAHSRAAAFVALAVGNAETLAREREVLDKFHDAATAVLSLLPQEPIGERFDDRVEAVKRAIEKLEPMRVGAHAARPEGQHRGVKVGLRAALHLGRTGGWDAADVAAILILMGVERGDYKSLADSLRHMEARPPKALATKRSRRR